MKNKKQGSLDINVPTCKVRFLWCLQFPLRINLITVGDARNLLVEKKIIETKEVKLPKEFDPANLTHLFVDKFVTLVEFHWKVIPGSDDGYIHTPYKDNIMKFPRENNGKLGISKGSYSREKVTFKSVRT